MRVTVREPSLHTFRTRPIQCCRLKSSINIYLTDGRRVERERDASFAVISGRVTSGREQTQLCTSFVFIDPIKHWLSLSKRIANTTRILACYFPVLSLIRNRDFSRLISPNFARFAINYISNFCMKGEEEEKKGKKGKIGKLAVRSRNDPLDIFYDRARRRSYSSLVSNGIALGACLSPRNECRYKFIWGYARVSIVG